MAGVVVAVVVVVLVVEERGEVFSFSFSILRMLGALRREEVPQKKSCMIRISLRNHAISIVT